MTAADGTGKTGPTSSQSGSAQNGGSSKTSSPAGPLPEATDTQPTSQPSSATNPQTNFYALLATPSQGRDRAWLDSFLAAAPSALLKIAEKRLIQGPDGFVYFHLINPVGDAEVDSAMVGAEGTFVVTTLADLAPDLYAKGIGAAIFTARHPGPAWVFSYGDIVNLQINGSFQADNGAFITPGDQPDDADGEAIAGPPPETLLPLTVRNWLRKFLEQFYQRPQVTLLIRKGQGMELLFDATPDRFPDQDTFQGALGALGWFLPRDYAYSVSNDPGYPFEPL